MSGMTFLWSITTIMWHLYVIIEYIIVIILLYGSHLYCYIWYSFNAHQRYARPYNSEGDVKLHINFSKKILFLYYDENCTIQFRNSKPSSSNLPFLTKDYAMRWKIQDQLCNVIEKDWSTVQDSKINKCCYITMLFLQTCIKDRERLRSRTIWIFSHNLKIKLLKSTKNYSALIFWVLYT